MSRMFSIRALSVGHIVIGVLLLPVALLFGGILAPILMAGPIWGIVLGVKLWQRGTEMFTALRRTHWAFLLIDVLLVAYGIFALRAAERSAARGGGLLGGIGLVPLGLGLVLALFSGVTLVICTEVNASAGQAVPGRNGVVQQWSGRVAQPLALEAPTKGFITNARDFATLWRVWRMTGEIPPVDFDRHVILVATARSSVLQVRAVQIDERGDLRTVVVATPDVTSDYAVVLTLAERKGVKTINRQPID